MTLELLLGVSAIGLTIYQAWLTRRHNRISFRPLLQWSYSRTLDDSGFHYKCTIQNAGLGPAIIKHIHLLKNGSPFEPQSGDPLREFVEPELKAVAKYRIRTTSLPRPKFAIRADTEHTLIEIEFPGLSSEALAKIKAPDIDVRIEYRSIYGDCFELDTRK